jgi:hypothetical protein
MGGPLMLLMLLMLASGLYGALFAYYGAELFLQFTVPLVLLAILAIWALPDTGAAPTRLLEVLLFTYLVGLVCWPNYLAIALPGLPWVTVIRIIGVPLAATLLICASCSAVFRNEFKAVLASSPVIWKMLVGFVFLQAISIVLSSDPPYAASKFLIAQLNWTAVFFASCYIFTRPKRIEHWAMLIWLVAIFVSLIGFQEWRVSKVLWAGHIPGFLQVEDPAVQRILEGAVRTWGGKYRVQSKFATSLGLAEFLSLALPFVIYFIMSPYRMAVRLAAAATVPFLLFIIVATDARLGMVGFFSSILFWTLLFGLLRWRRQVRSLFGPAIALSYPVVFGLFVTATFFVGRLRHLVWGSGAQQFSTDARQLQYEMGIPKVLTHPLGHGIGEASFVLGYTNRAGQLTIDTYYLSIALDHGIIGFILYYGMFLLAIYKAARIAIFSEDRELSLAGPVAIALINFVVIKSVLSQQENHPLAFMMLGMVVALTYHASRIARKDAPAVIERRPSDSLVRSIRIIRPRRPSAAS